VSAEAVFALVSQAAMATWILMLAFPRRHVVVTTIAGGITPVLLGVVYAALIAAWWRSSDGGFSSLAGVAALFSNEWLLLAGWVHYLAFDLLVGRWELLDSQKRGIPHPFVLPCLLLTFMFGPGGWLLYLALRAAWRRRQVATRAETV
jgi:hypothetical protein